MRNMVEIGHYPYYTLKEVEKYVILKKLELTKGNKTKAAKLLGIGKTYLYSRLKEYKQG